jgi:hypothetical protein
LQGIGVIKGTFCVIDLTFYLIFFFSSVLFFSQRRSYETKTKII